MTKVIFALGFVGGALCMSIFFGNYTSTLVQGAATGPLAGRFVPSVPPISNVTLRGTGFENMRVELDGLKCHGCKFGGKVVLAYSGGFFELKDALFSSPTINLELRGAALNTFILLRYLQSLKAAPKEEKFPWENPKWSINVKRKITTDWVTPINK